MNLHPITRLDEAPLFAGLTNAQLRSWVEPANGIFIAESPKVIASALRAGCVPVAMLTARRHLAPQAALIDRCGDIPVYTADDETLAQLTGYALTRGVLCAMRRPQPRTMASVCRNARRIAVLENIVDATNVGALFRSAAALNMDGVLVTPSCCDPLCRRAVRVSMGTVFDIPWATAGDAPADWPTRGLAQLRAMGVRAPPISHSGDSSGAAARDGVPHRGDGAARRHPPAGRPGAGADRPAGDCAGDGGRRAAAADGRAVRRHGLHPDGTWRRFAERGRRRCGRILGAGHPGRICGRGLIFGAESDIIIKKTNF